jgi:hypothetical protein
MGGQLGSKFFNGEYCGVYLPAEILLSRAQGRYNLGKGYHAYNADIHVASFTFFVGCERSINE